MARPRHGLREDATSVVEESAVERTLSHPRATESVLELGVGSAVDGPLIQRPKRSVGPEVGRRVLQPDELQPATRSASTCQIRKSRRQTTTVSRLTQSGIQPSQLRPSK